MKKLILTAAVAVALGTSAFADGTTKKSSNTNNVSYQVLNQFDVQFDGAENVTWSATSVGQKADFVLDDVKMTAFYDNRGQFIGTTQDVNIKKLPASARKEIAAKYQGYQIAEVIKFQSGDNTADLNYYGLQGSESTAYFVDLKNDKEEFLVRVTPQSSIYFYKQIK